MLPLSVWKMDLTGGEFLHIGPIISLDIDFLLIVFMKPVHSELSFSVVKRGWCFQCCVNNKHSAFVLG